MVKNLSRFSLSGYNGTRSKTVVNYCMVFSHPYEKPHRVPLLEKGRGDLTPWMLDLSRIWKKRLRSTSCSVLVIPGEAKKFSRDTV